MYHWNAEDHQPEFKHFNKVLTYNFVNSEFRNISSSVPDAMPDTNICVTNAYLNSPTQRKVTITPHFS